MAAKFALFAKNLLNSINIVFSSIAICLLKDNPYIRPPSNPYEHSIESNGYNCNTIEIENNFV